MKNNETILSNLKNASLILTFFFLWLAVFSEEYIENIFAYILILTFGIVHGANDIKLIGEVVVLKNAQFLKTLIYYIVFILISAAFFYFVPAIALLLFVIFSGYHFGEQHWFSKTKGSVFTSAIFFLSYGLFILFLMFDAHKVLVNEVVLAITSFAIPNHFYLIGLVCSAFVMSIGYMFLKHDKWVASKLVREIFLLLVFFIVFNTASLLWSFAIYFILWHSIPSLVDQIIFLYGSYNQKNALNYMKSSFFYWLIAVTGLLVALFFFKDSFQESLALFFSLLAAITFPHVLVIKKINNA
jgi:Brp/Blh family beta-carotene 15,15'-monooxygenase